MTKGVLLFFKTACFLWLQTNYFVSLKHMLHLFTSMKLATLSAKEPITTSGYQPKALRLGDEASSLP